MKQLICVVSFLLLALPCYSQNSEATASSAESDLLIKKAFVSLAECYRTSKILEASCLQTMQNAARLLQETFSSDAALQERGHWFSLSRDETVGGQPNPHPAIGLVESQTYDLQGHFDKARAAKLNEFLPLLFPYFNVLRENEELIGENKAILHVARDVVAATLAKKSVFEVGFAYPIDSHALFFREAPVGQPRFYARFDGATRRSLPLKPVIKNFFSRTVVLNDTYQIAFVVESKNPGGLILATFTWQDIQDELGFVGQDTTLLGMAVVSYAYLANARIYETPRPLEYYLPSDQISQYEQVQQEQKTIIKAKGEAIRKIASQLAAGWRQLLMRRLFREGPRR